MITIDTRIEQACSKDSRREHLMHPYYTGKAIVASNGKGLVCLNGLDYEGLGTPGHIPLEAIKFARKQKGARKGVITLAERAVVEGESFSRDFGRFRNWEHCVPKANTWSDDNLIICNPYALAGIAKATGSSFMLLNDVGAWFYRPLCGTTVAVMAHGLARANELTLPDTPAERDKAAGLDPALLLRMTQALGGSTEAHVRLQETDATISPVRINLPMRSAKDFAILMPRRR